MKKLMMTAAVAAMIFATTTTVNAQTERASSVKMEKSAQDGFQKIETSQLADAIKTAVEKDFKGASIAKAYMNKEKDFKLVLETEGKEPKTVYANAKGEWIKPMA